MSQQRVPVWAADADDIDEDDVDLSLAIGNYPQNSYDPDASSQPQIDEATFLAMQQHMVQQAAFAQIPDVVKRFIVHFHQAVLDNNLAEITVAYERGWTSLTEKFYAKTEWPEAEIIAPLVNDDQIFLILYRELYYRHVYSRLQPDIDDRFHSYENSCELFNYLLNSDGPVPLELPEQWLWDIIDEFIYQFQAFCQFASRPRQRTDDERAALAEGAHVWSAYSVLNVLYSLIQKSRINEVLRAQTEGKSEEEVAEVAGEYGVRPIYRMLGYFSVVGLLRVHVLLGDFTLALKVMENIELTQKSPFTRVTACHVATYYYVGFCYIMLRRYPDAARTFATILNFTTRMRPYHTRSYQYDQINKTADRMYALFALCSVLAPGRLDDNVAHQVKERYGEQITKMSRGEDGIATFDELFLYACPKFIAAHPPPYADPAALATVLASEAPSQDPAQRHLAALRMDARAPPLRSTLRLYTRIGAGGLARVLGGEEEDVVQSLMAVKLAGKRVSRVGEGRGLLEGEEVATSDLNFVIDENMIHIAETTVGRRYAGWFIRQSEAAARCLDTLRNTPLPGPKTAAAPSATSAPAGAHAPGPTPAQAAGASRTGGPKVAWGGVKVA